MPTDLEMSATELVAEHGGNLAYLQACGFERSHDSAIACDQPVRGYRALNGLPIPACKRHEADGGYLNHTALLKHHAAVEGYECGSWSAALFIARALRAMNVDAVDITAGNGQGWVAFGEPEGTHHPFRLDTTSTGGAVVRDWSGDPVAAVSGDLAAVVALAVEVATAGAEQ